MRDVMIATFKTYLKALPRTIFDERPAMSTVPLKDTIPNLNRLVQEIAFPFYDDNLSTFKRIRQTFTNNVGHLEK